MAISINWKIVRNRDIKKSLKPKKVEVKKSIVQRKVYWIEENNLKLYEWSIIEENWNNLKIDCYCRSKIINPDKKREIVYKDKSDISFFKE
jgi:hypothetical protein